MDVDDQPIFGGIRRSDDAAIEESGFLGAHRRWTNINACEVIFLVLGILAALASDGLTIYRMATLPDIKDPDFAYGILLIVNSIFLVIFLMTGIFQQRITDIVAFFASAVMLTIYVVVHYIVRKEEPDDEKSEATIRLARLIFTVAFNIFFIPFSVYVIKDYQRNEFSIRLFGAFPAARQPLKLYNIFDCVARINAMFSISVCILNLFNFNSLLNYDEILLSIGIPVAILWLCLGVGMLRLENKTLFIVFCVFALYQPGFLIYCLLSVLDHPSDDNTTTTSSTRLTTLITTQLTTSPTTQLYVDSGMNGLTSITTIFPDRLALLAAHTLPIKAVLYVCMALNILTHLLTFILSIVCVRNFGKGLKERVFNSRSDKFCQNCFSRNRRE